MIEFWLISTATAAAIIAAIFGCLIFFRTIRATPQEYLTKEVCAQLLRIETDTVKKAGDDHARNLREEVASSLKGFNDGTQSAFRTLLEFINSQLRDFGDRLTAGTKAMDEKVEGIGTKLNSDLSQMGTEAHKNRDALRQIVETKLDEAVAKQTSTAKDGREEMNSSFQRLGDRVADTLNQANTQQKERLDNTTTALASLTERLERAQETLRQVIEGRLDAIRQESAAKLDEMRQMVDEKLQATLETRLEESFTRVVEQLNQMHQGIGEMKTLAASVGDLKHMLTNPKIRGTFGEVQLATLLEQFLAPDQYVKNAQVKQESGERVEFAIKMPGSEGTSVLLPVDAKFPIEDYQKLIEASEAGEAELVVLFRRQLQGRIKACARDIRDKYINPPATTDFGVLFLPTESLYAEVLREAGLLETLHREYRVTLAGPSTLAAYLNALQMGFRTLAIEKRSSEVWQVLGAVRGEFSKYNGVVQTLATQLNRAVTSVDKLGTRTRVMARTLRTVETIPDDSTAEKLLGLTPEELVVEDDDSALPVTEGIPAEIIVQDSAASTSETPQTSSPPPSHSAPH